jgi:hypothetical protein
MTKLTVFAEGEIYTRADGKRVRRVKRPVSNLPGDVPSSSGHTAKFFFEPGRGEIFTPPTEPSTSYTKDDSQINSNELEDIVQWIDSFVIVQVDQERKKRCRYCLAVRRIRNLSREVKYINKDGRESVA